VGIAAADVISSTLCCAAAGARTLPEGVAAYQVAAELMHDGVTALRLDRLGADERRPRAAAYAVRTHTEILTALITAARGDLRAMGDLGYEGESDTITVAFKKPKAARLTLVQQQFNTDHNRLRAIGERGNSLLTMTFKALQRQPGPVADREGVIVSFLHLPLLEFWCGIGLSRCPVHCRPRRVFPLDREWRSGGECPSSDLVGPLATGVYFVELGQHLAGQAGGEPGERLAAPGPQVGPGVAVVVRAGDGGLAPAQRRRVQLRGLQR
jgi:hypothetical protein